MPTFKVLLIMNSSRLPVAADRRLEEGYCADRVSVHPGREILRGSVCAAAAGS
jgi:hypothetical protein